MGNGSSEAYSDVPVTVKGLTGVKSLVGDRNGYGTGFGFCAVWGSGGVKCWGSNDALISGGVEGSGLLGNGSTEASSDVPVTVKGLAGVKSLASDQAGYCALLKSGGAECWGDNDYNELGDGQLGDLAGSNSSSQVFSNVPVAVKGLTGAASSRRATASATAPCCEMARRSAGGTTRLASWKTAASPTPRPTWARTCRSP